MSEKTKKRPNKEPNYTVRRIVALGSAMLLAAGIYESTKGETNHPIRSSDEVKEYVVKPNDTSWTIANRAFPNQVNDPEKMFEVRQEIEGQLPKDARHENGMLQPGDELVFAANAHLRGNKVTLEQATKDMQRKMGPVFYGTNRGKDGAHRRLNTEKTRLLLRPIQ